MSCLNKLSEILNCRRILCLMVFSSFVMNAVLKISFNITIVAMVRKENDTNPDLFDWNEGEKQNILGLFFWGFALTKIPSGRLAETIGSRKVTGWSMVLASILTILTPIICYWNYYVLLTSRVMMGFLIGASWPAIMPLAAKWIPPKEHSVFISCLASSAIGVALTYHLSGFIIAAYGWQSVFYLAGGVSLLWSFAWFYLIYDSPQQHPRISLHEKHLLECQIDKSSKPKRLHFSQIPWKEIVTSGPVWAIVAGQTATFFGFTTLCTQGPSYMDQVLHVNIEQNGLFSGMPYWGGYFAALTSGYLADGLRKSNRLSTTTIRKLFETVSLLIPSLCMLSLALWGDSTAVALTGFTISLTVNAVSTAGHCANILDISHNYAGTICGLVNTVSAFSAYFSTKLVAQLLRNDHTFQEWRYLFGILFGSYFSTTIIYLVLCSGNLQKWDEHKMQERKTKNYENNNELQLLSEKSVP
ncbi:sialin [Tribolium castaneum]|uniref:sialin n=1 Tax=Tribolium castaneum TaxID=7070 RepID=UPI0030FF0943